MAILLPVKPMPLATFLLVVSAALLCMRGRACAEGGFHPPAEMVRHSEFIAIVTVDRVTPLPTPANPRWHFSQRAQATVERNVIGALPRVIEIYGGENFVCQQTDLSPGRYLAFLVRSFEGHLESANYQMGIRPIRGDSVEWYYRAGDPLTPLFGYKLRWQRLDRLVRHISSSPRPNQAIQRTAGRSDFQLKVTSNLSSRPRALSHAVADLEAR